MNLSVGIVGLPNVGKSTLFNALLQKQVAAVANYPFCTIEPNKGVVGVPDERLSVLAKIVGTARLVPAAVEFIDIAGLVKGAAQGEGLGNKFLANIREVSVIVHVVRFFVDDSVSHVERKIDPATDVEIVNSELILADLETLEKQKPPKGKVEKEALIFWEAVQILNKAMNQGQLAKDVPLNEKQKAAIKRLSLLTAKPVLYVANADEDQLKNAQKVVQDFPYQPVIFLSAKMEADLAGLAPADQKAYLKEYQLTEPGLNRLIKVAYETLGLISFLTAGPMEARAWTIKKGSTARQAAGVIHTDFAKGFIKAEVIAYQDFVYYGGWEKAKALGKVRAEGADYQVQDGEVVEFKFN